MKKESDVRSLLDANVLIAYLDSDHTFHERAFSWFSSNHKRGWASSPLIENGVLRILSNPNYSGVRKFPLSQLIDKFQELTRITNHQFWPDDISLLDDSYFDTTSVMGPHQFTDVYLLALASHHNGRLITFDERIPISAVRNALPENLCVI